MGKIQVFEINLSHENGVYYAGELLKGQAILELNEPLSLRGIKIHFEGHTTVEWTQGSGDNRQTYRATEKYFDHQQLILGHKLSDVSTSTTTSTATTQDLGVGRHEFPFRFRLPLNLPTSFEDGIGCVKYVVSCNIDLPSSVLLDSSVHRPFTVLGILNLNYFPGSTERLQGTKEKFLGCCRQKGRITAKICIDKTGYVPGEAMRIFAEINNDSDTRMDKSFVNIMMYTTFTAQTPFPKQKIGRTEVARVTHPAIPAYSKDIWSGDLLVVPPLPPSFMEGCSFIDVNYVLTFQVDPSGSSSNLEIPFDIIIGTIPVYTYFVAPTNMHQLALGNQPVHPTSVSREQTPPRGKRP